MTHKIPLTAEFPAATESTWRALVDAALKGAPFEKKLIVTTRDGISLPALSPRDAQAQAIIPARGAAPWAIAARMDHPDAQEANRLALEELEGGADILILSLAGSRGARGFGLPDCAPQTLDAAFAGIHLDLVSLRLEPGEGAAAQALALAHWLKGRGYVPAALRVDFGLPLGDAATVQTIQTLIAMGFSGPFLTCDGRMVHEAGGSEAQELASVLAAAVQGLRDLTAAGLSLAAARAALGFTLVADQDQVVSLSKIRAARLLIARVDEACDLANQNTPLHVETAWRMQTRQDCYVTCLRNVIAAFAAGAGGVDSLAILPHTAALGLPDGAARRLARNTSHILVEETHLARVVDPAAGSGTLERVTRELCEKAWSIFQQIEGQSIGNIRGLPAALENGFLAGLVSPVQKARVRDIATRRAAITGTSEFPNINEPPVAVLMPRRVDVYASPLPIHRDSEAFEKLRERAEVRAASGHKPSVFLANLGRIADFSARATFAKNLFEAGGITAIGNDGFAHTGRTDIPALAAAFAASGARMACLCGADDGYQLEGVEAARALHSAGAQALFMAGRPGEQEVALRAAGLADFIFAGMDVLTFLDAALMKDGT